jgi:hypothetical protein
MREAAKVIVVVLLMGVVLRKRQAQHSFNDEEEDSMKVRKTIMAFVLLLFLPSFAVAGETCYGQQRP